MLEIYGFSSFHLMRGWCLLASFLFSDDMSSTYRRVGRSPNSFFSLFLHPEFAFLSLSAARKIKSNVSLWRPGANQVDWGRTWRASGLYCTA